MSEPYHVDKKIGIKKEPEDFDSFLLDLGANFRIKYEDDYEKKYQVDQYNNDTLFESVSVETSVMVVVQADLSGCSASQVRIKQEPPNVKAEEQTPRPYIELSSFKIIDVSKLMHEDGESQDLHDEPSSSTSTDGSPPPEPMSEDEENVGRKTESESEEPSPPGKYRKRVGEEAAGVEGSLTKRWPCSKCSVVVKSESDRVRHLREVHRQVKPFTCSVCRASFSRRRSMDHHFLRLHQRKRKTKKSPPDTTHSLVCCCGKVFLSPWELKRHSIVHTDGKQYSCKECDRKFASKEYLNKHLVTHNGAKPFSCDDCGKSFKEKGSLKFHVATHIGVKPFTCCSCDSSFYRRKDLNRHAMTHSKQKPFSCSPCRKSFTRRSQLRTHNLRYHPDSILRKGSLKRTTRSK